MGRSGCFRDENGGRTVEKLGEKAARRVRESGNNGSREGVGSTNAMAKQEEDDNGEISVL